MQLIRVDKPDYFKFSETLHFLDRGYDDVLYDVNSKRVRKAIQVGKKHYLLEIEDDDSSLLIRILNESDVSEDQQTIISYVVEWFDLARDMISFYETGKLYPIENMFEQYQGLRLVMIPDLFEALSWSIIGQQINLTFAYSLKRRLVELCDNKITYNNQSYYTFPTPLQISQLSIDDLRERQFSQRKAEYLIGLGELFLQGKYDKKSLSRLTSTEDMISELVKIRGIGEWSANYALMKSLGRMDCITHGDTGLQAAVKKYLQLDRKPTKEEVIQFLKPYENWESYMVFFLWRSLT